MLLKVTNLITPPFKSVLTHVLSSLLIVLFFGINVYAGDLNAYKKQLISATNDSVRVDLYTKIAYEYIKSNYDTALIYADSATFFTPNSKSDKLNGIAFLAQGNILRYQNKLKAALVSLDQARAYFIKAKDYQDECVCKATQAVIFYLNGNFEKSIELCLDAEKTALANDYQNVLANIYSTLANIYYDLGDSENDLKYNLKALEIYTILDDKFGIGASLNNISDNYKSKGDAENALKYINQAIELKQFERNFTGLATSLMTKGEIYLEVGKTDLALMNFNKAIDIWKSIGSSADKLAYSYSYMAKSLIKVNKLQEALKFEEEALVFADSSNDVRVKAETNRVLSSIHEKLNHSDLALNYYKRYNFFADSLLSIEKIKSIREIEAKYENEKSIAQIADLKEDAERKSKELRLNRIIIISILIMLSLLILLSGLIYRLYRNKKSLSDELSNKLDVIEEQHQTITEFNKELSAKNDQLMIANNQKEQMLRMVSHDIKSPLYTISGFITLIEEEYPTLDDNLKSYLSHIQQSVTHQIAMAKNWLDQNFEFDKPIHLNKKKYDIQLILADIVNFYKRGEKNRTIILECPRHLFVYFDKMVIQEVITNLLVNAIKYSEKEVVIRVVENDAWIDISISDKGSGIDPEKKDVIFSNVLTVNQTTKNGSSGHGLLIVKMLCELHEIELSLDSKQGIGSTFTIKMLKEKIDEEKK